MNSKEVAQKIVEMKFDNAQFEKNAQQSISTIDNLKKSLDFDGVSDGVQVVGKSFSALETIVKGALLRIGGQIADTTTRFVKSMSIDNIAAGWSKFGDKTTAVQTIMSATTQTWEANANAIERANTLMANGVDKLMAKGIAEKYDDISKGILSVDAAAEALGTDTGTVEAFMRQLSGVSYSGEQMDYVNDQLERLNWFTDETSYKLLEMTQSIGKFTANNIPLDKSVTAMQGIATWAGISGANAGEASRAMYNLSQAVAVGSVKLMDWKSIENANMATAEFKQTAIDTAVALGTLTKAEDGTYQTLAGNTVSATNFNEALSDAWFSSEVLLQTLDKYGGFSVELQKVADKTNLSAKELLDYIDEYKEGSLDFDDVLQSVKEAGGDTSLTVEELTSDFNVLTDSTMELGERAFRAAQEAKTFGEVLDYVKEAVSTGWMNTFQLIFGNYKEAKKLWSDLAEEFYEIFVKTGDLRNSILETWKEAGGREDLTEGFWNILHAITAIIDAVRSAADDIFKPVFSDVEDGAARIWTLTARFRQFTETLRVVDEETGELNETGQKIKSTFRGIFAAIGIVIDVAKALFKALVPGFSGLGGSVLDTAANFGEMIVQFRETIQESGVLEAITEKLGGTFKAVRDFIGDLIDSARRFVKLFKFDGVAASLDFLNSLTTDIVDFVFNIVSALTGKDLSNARDGVVSFINKIYETLLKFWGVIKPVVLGIKELFSGSIDAIKDFFKSFKDIDFKPADDFKEKTEKTFSPLKTFFDGVKKLFSGLGSLFTSLKPVFSGIISAVGRVLGVIGGAISDIVKNFDFTKLGNVLETGLKVGIGVKLFGFIDNLKNISEKGKGFFGQIKDMFKGITDLIKTFKEMADAKTLETKSKALKNMAIAIGILAASLFVLSSIEPHKLQASMTVITMLMGELIGAIALLGKIGKKAKLKEIGTTMMEFGAAILILSLAVKTLAKLDPEAMGASVMAISLLMAEMVAAAKILSGKKNKNMMDGAKNAIAFAIAIRIMASAVKVLAKLDPESLGRAVMAFSLLMAELVGAAKILSGKDNGRMMKGAANAVIFAIAIRVLVSSVKSLGKLQPEQLINGMIGVSLLIAEMVFAAKMLGDNKEAKSMMKGAANALIFAIALRVLVSSVKSLGKMPLNQMVNGLAGITALLLAMVMASKSMEGSMKGSGAMIVAASAMIVLALALKLLGTLSWEQIGKGLAAVAGAFTIMGVAALVLKPLVPTILALAGAMALIGLSSILFGAGLLMVSAALAALAKSASVVQDSIINLIIGLITAIPEMVSALADSLKEASSSIISCIVEVVRAALIALKEVVPEAVDVILELTLSTLAALGENIQPIVESLLDIVVGVIKGLASGAPEILSATLDLLKGMIEAIMEAFDGMDLKDMLKASAALALFGIMMAELAAISVLAMVAVMPLPFIGAKLSQFIEAAEPFLQRIEEVDPATLQGAKALAEMILILTANDILDSLTSWFTGGNSMVEFGKQLAEFAPYIKKYSDEIQGIDSGAVEASANAALALAQMATNLPNSGGVVSWFTGDNSLSDFAEELVKFGPKLKEYADSVTGLNSAVVINSILAANAVSGFAKNLPNSGGVASWFAGENSLAAFGEELAAFGPHLKAYAMSVTGLDSSVVVQSMVAAKSISEFAENLPNSGGVVSWFTGDNTISEFGENLAEFGKYLLEYSMAVQGINLSAFMAIIPGLESLVSIGSDISNINSSGIGTFAEEFVELATNGVNGLINTFIDSTPEVEASIAAMLMAAMQMVDTIAPDFQKAGIKIATQFVNGIKRQKNNVKIAFVASLTFAIYGIQSYYYRFRETGAYLVSGFVNGIDSNRWKAEAAAKALASRSLTAARKELDEKSPSKKAYEIGDYYGRGYINGLYANVKNAGYAAAALAEATIVSMNSVLSRVADWASGTTESQPTIRPVMDLTEVRDGYREISLMNTKANAQGIAAKIGSNAVQVNEDVGPAVRPSNTTFIQNNYSPKALNASEIYRQTKNQFTKTYAKTNVVVQNRDSQTGIMVRNDSRKWSD